MPNYSITEINEVSLPQFQEYTDQFGMMTGKPGEGSGNGNLFTGHYAFGLHANGILSEKEKKRITQVFLNNMREPGLVNRLPGANNWYQAHDDLLGIIGADALMNPCRKDRKLTQMIYEHGKICADGLDSNEPDPEKAALNKKVYFWARLATFNHIRWVWNNVQPHKFHVSSWLGRRMEVIATMQMAKNKWLVNPFYWTYWALDMLQLAYFGSDSKDSYTLSFHRAVACEGFGPITNWICRKTRARIQRDWGDFGKLLCSYFANPAHPIGDLCKDKY